MSSPFQQQFSAKSPLNQGLILENDNRPREVINAETKKAIEKREAVTPRTEPTIIPKYKPKVKEKAVFVPSTELSDEDIEKMKSNLYRVKSPLNDLRKSNSGRKTKTKTKKKDPMRGGYKKLKKKEQDK